MSDAYAPPIKRSGSLDIYAGGMPYSIRDLSGFSGCAAAQAQVIRRVAAGKMEVEVGNKLVQMIAQVARTLHFQRKTQLEERKLDLLGAAAEQGAAVFEGLAIVPPRSRAHPTPETAAPPVLNMEQGEAMTIKAPGSKGGMK